MTLKIFAEKVFLPSSERPHCRSNLNLELTF